MHEANRILRSVKTALAVDGIKLPPSAETDGLMTLLGRADGEKALVPKIKHARASGAASAAHKRAAAYFAFSRALSAYVKGIPDPATTVSFTMLNRTLYGDLFDNAGRTRQTDYTENGSAHTDPKYIVGSIKSIISKMNEIKGSPEISKEDFAGYLTHYMRELIILHPFECGSPFTVRMFIMLFCKIKGFALCYYRCAPAAIKAAETAAFVADDVTALFRIFSDCLSYEQTTEKKRAYPKTRRELSRDLSKSVAEAKDSAENAEKSAPEPEKTDKTEKSEKSEKPEKPERPERREREREREKTNRKPPAPTREKSDRNGDRLKRAIKLQQKISRLNEQLTELMVGDDKD